MWISHHLVFAVAGKNPPQMMRGIKKLEQSGVWDAHRSFASGRPNEAVCGMHTASFASGRSNETVCGLHIALLASGMTVQEGGGTNALLPTHGFLFLSPSPSSFPLLLLFLPSSLPRSS